MAKSYGLSKDGRGIWHADFSVAGQRIQRSTFTEDRAAAEEWCAQTAAQIWRERKLGEKPALKWEDAVARWVKAKEQSGKRDLANDLDKARLLGERLNGKALHTLTTIELDDLLDELQRKRSWSVTTRNRHRSFIMGVLNHHRKKGYAVPVLAIERHKEPEGVIRFLTHAEAETLLRELPVHLRRMVQFTLATGLRQSNVTGLRWRDVDLERRIAWVWADEAKGKRHIGVPLNDDAVAVLNEAKACPKHGSERLVFTYHGRAVEQPANWAWLKALGRAGIKEFRWHDLRHTWASWHAQNGTPLLALQQLGGWADIRMVRKYAHLGPDDVARFAGNVKVSA